MGSGGGERGRCPRRFRAPAAPTAGAAARARAASPRRAAARVICAGASVTAPLSASIYISGARCPMASGEPIRWQIRCQLGGSCLETVAASLPPQFKFRTWRRGPGRSSGTDRPAGPAGSPHRRAHPGKALRRGPPPRHHRAYLPIDRRSYRAGAGGAGGGGGPPGARVPLLTTRTFPSFFFFTRFDFRVCLERET